MGIILKENNLIHTKKRHEKFLGSSTYKYNQGTNTIYKKPKKPKPNIPIYQDVENEASTHGDITENIKSLASSNPKFAKFHETYNPDTEPKKRKEKTGYKLNKKKVREKCSAFFGLKQSRTFMAFYSISFPQNFPDDYAYKCLNTVLTRLRDKCRLKSYQRFSERQKNGTIHFHMVTNNYMPVRTFNYFMAKAIDNQIRSKKNQGKINVNFDITTYNGVDVRHVNNNRKALNSYLTKYVSKNDELFDRLPYHSSRDISELFTAETFRNVDSWDFQPIRKAIKHITAFVVDNEWCTIEYLNQKQPNGKFFNPPDEWYWLRDHLNEQIYKNHYAKHKHNPWCI